MFGLAHSTVDDDIARWVVAHRIGWLDSVFHVITTVGNTLSMAVIAVIATAVCVSARLVSQAWLIAIGSITGYLTMVGLKHLIARDRPPARDRLVDIDTYAFPSGHAMVSGIVLGLVAVAAWQTSSWVRDHRAVLLIVPLASVLVGISRVYLGVHWTTDVIGGWVLALAWIALAVAVARWVRGRPVSSVPAARSGRHGGSPDAES